MEAGTRTIYTIGHSTRPIADLIRMLKLNGVELLVDVRSVPKSRYNPQYNIESLEREIPAAGIHYVNRKGLGGMRKPDKNSVNAGWENASFRGFADYMQGSEFGENIQWLENSARRERTCFMCAEAVPWRCHRTLISDAMTARGWRVCHIMDGSLSVHKVTPFAHVDGTKVTYPGPLDVFNV